MARVLVVEDEVLVSLDIAQCVRDEGHEVCGICTTAADAIAAAEREDPQLIIMDITLRGSPNGIAAARVIRGHSDVPIIFLTAHTDYASQKEAGGVIPHAYLVKPFTETDLRDAVRSALSDQLLK